MAASKGQGDGIAGAKAPLRSTRPWSWWANTTYCVFASVLLVYAAISGLGQGFSADRGSGAGNDELWHARTAVLLLMSAFVSEVCLLAASWGGGVGGEDGQDIMDLQDSTFLDSSLTLFQYSIKFTTSMYLYTFDGGFTHLDTLAIGGARVVYIARHLQWSLGVPVFILSGNRCFLSGQPMSVLLGRCAPAMLSSVLFTMSSWTMQVTTDFPLRWLLFSTTIIGPVLVIADQLVLAFQHRGDEHFRLKLGTVLYQAFIMSLYGLCFCCSRLNFIPALSEQLFYAYADTSICIIQGALLSMIRHNESVDMIKHWWLSAQSAKDDLDNLIEKATVPVFTVDLHGTVLLWNKSLEALLGLPAEAVCGRPLAQLVTEESRLSMASGISKALARGLAGREEHVPANSKAKARSDDPAQDDVAASLLQEAPIRVELFFPIEGAASPGASKRGMRHMCLSLVAKTTKDGMISGIMAIGQDLSELSELKSMQQKKSALMAMMSHEIRSPLHGILGLTETLLVTDEFKGNKQLGMVKGCAARLIDLVTNIMELAQHEKQRASGIMTAPPQALVDFGAIAHEVVTMSRMAVDKTNRSLVKPDVQLINDCVNTRLPLIRGCPHKCTQLIYNLMTNACKFTEEGSVTISAEFKADAQRLEVSVADTGFGISEEGQKRIFMPFEQEENSDNKTRSFQGIGLGLAVCSEICNFLSGGLSVASTLGRGSVFTVSVPCDGSMGWGEEFSAEEDKRCEAAAALALPAQKPIKRKDSFAKAVPESSSRPLILSVDDDEPNQEVVRRALCGFCDVHCAMNGAEALRFVDRRQRAGLKMPDGLLIDYRMPDMNGFEVLQELKKHFDSAASKMPIIMVSSNLFGSEALAEYTAGATDFVRKPFSPDCLMRKDTQVFASMSMLVDQAAERVNAIEGARAAEAATSELLSAENDALKKQLKQYEEQAEKYREQLEKEKLQSRTQQKAHEAELAAVEKAKSMALIAAAEASKSIASAGNDTETPTPCTLTTRAEMDGKARQYRVLRQLTPEVSGKLENAKAVFALMASRLNLVNKVTKSCEQVLDLTFGQPPDNFDHLAEIDTKHLIQAHYQIIQVIRSQLQILDLATGRPADWAAGAGGGVCVESKTTSSATGENSLSLGLGGSGSEGSSGEEADNMQRILMFELGVTP